MKTMELIGLFVFFLIIDSLILILRDLSPNFVWTLVIGLLIIQLATVFILNEKYRSKNNLDWTHNLWLLLGIGLLGLVTWILLTILESRGLTTILRV